MQSKTSHLEDYILREVQEDPDEHVLQADEDHVQEQDVEVEPRI
jgi:hypothetical protein